MYISPAAWWPVGFISLIYPFLLVLVLGLTFLSIFIRFRYVLLGLVSIALSFTTIMNIVPLRADAHFQVKKDERDIRILTWNIRRFTPYYRNYFDPKHNNFDTILIEVKKYDPDILCFQEFFTSKKNNEKTINEIKKLGYRYYAFNRHSFSNTEALDEGNIIFSKFPIIREINVEIDRASSFGWEKSGDLNDVPSSYAYLSVRGKLNDTFLEQGAGLGKTFMSGRSRFLTWLPTLRIDYIFADQSIDVNQFSMTNGSLSDHRGVISDFQLPKKQ